MSDAGSKDIALSPKTAALLSNVEKYVLPLVYAFLAWRQFRYLQIQSVAWHSLAGTLPMPSHSCGVHFADMTKHGLIFALMTFTGLTLLLNRPPVRMPGKLKHVIVPLAVSYYFVLYGAVDSCPAWLRESLMPPDWRYSAAVLGLMSSIAGYLISIWALMYLRRSFGNPKSPVTRLQAWWIACSLK